MTDAGTTEHRAARASGLPRVLSLILIDLVLLALLFETVPRLVDIPGLLPGDLRPAAGPTGLADQRLIPHPHLGYALRPGWRAPRNARKKTEHNQLGFRGPEVSVAKPPGTFRILCLGGSSTYGTGPTTTQRTWPAQLQALLDERPEGGPYEVINLGCIGWNSTESLLNLTLRGVDLEPDLVLVYHATNDASVALWPEPTWDNHTFRKNLHDNVELSAGEQALERSYLYLIWRRYCTDHHARTTQLDVNAIRGYTPAHTEPDLGRALPDQGFHNFERNLRSIADIALGRGARVAFMTQAFNPADGEGEHFWNGQNRAQAQQRMVEIVREVALQLDVPLLDIESALEDRARTQLDKDGEQTLFVANVHLTNQGALFLAKRLRVMLGQRKLLD